MNNDIQFPNVSPAFHKLMRQKVRKHQKETGKHNDR